MSNTRSPITTDREWHVLARLSGPMIFGIMGIMIFNLVDTWYVSRLGIKQMAALSFTFPVVMVITSIAHGLGVGITAAVSKARGRGDRQQQIDLTTWGITLALIIVVFFVMIGLATIGPVFRCLGADAELVEIIRQYMSIWYWGVVFVLVPMCGNAALRGIGNTVIPSKIMIYAALCNAVLDPAFIFGFGPIPPMGVSGAALATVIARGTACAAALYFLIFREKLISFSVFRFSVVIKTWKEILYLGIPNVLTKILKPAAAGIITSFIALHGEHAVAAFGIVSRLEMFILVILMAVISIIPVFVGQNWGAGLFERVKNGIVSANYFSMGYSLILYVILFFTARPLISLFSSDPRVVDVACSYMKIVPMVYGLQGILMISSSALTVIKRPVISAGLTLFQMFILYIPLAWLAQKYYGVSGIFISLAFSYLLITPVCFYVNKRFFK